MATLRALKHFGFFWTPAAEAICLQEFTECFRPRLSPDTQNKAFTKNKSRIQILDTNLESLVGLHETLFLVVICSLWSEYIVAFDKEMIGTIYKKRLWFHSALVWLKNLMVYSIKCFSWIKVDSTSEEIFVTGISYLFSYFC